MKAMRMPHRAYLWALLGGILLPFAFAPFQQYGLAFVAPLLLLYSWQNLSARQAALAGLLFGWGFFGIGVSWLFISMRNYGNMSMLLAGAVTLLFVTGLALFPALQGYLLNRFSPKNTVFKTLGLFPASWLLLELVRGTALTGFPWLLIGYTQLNTPLNGFAPLMGVYGLSWLTVFSSACLYCLWEYGQKKYTRLSIGLVLPILSVAIIWLSGLWLQTIPWTQPLPGTIQVSLIQGNIPEKLKWDYHYRIPIIKRYEALTRAHLDSDLIIWPEAALPVYQQQIAPYLTQLSHLLIQSHSTLLAGIALSVSDQSHQKAYNGLISLGNGKGSYAKQHLVPFGEYTPFASYLKPLIEQFNIPMSDFTPGKSHQPPIIIDHAAIAPFICYEIAYPLLVNKDAYHRGLLVVITDDSWFGHSIAAAQHLQIAQMRALETHRYLLFSANNGITAVISPTGRVIKKIPPFQEGVLSLKHIQLRQGSTPLMRFSRLF